MRIFIAWSGLRSQAIAKHLRSWFPNFIQALKPFLSTEDIAAGSRWSANIAKQLQDSDFGVICLTRDNIFSPWIHFESGALSVPYEKERVCPILVDREIGNRLPDTLKQFQLTTITKDNFGNLLRRFNSRLELSALSDQLLDGSLERNWAGFESEFTRIRLIDYQDSITPGALGSALDYLGEAGKLDDPIFRDLVIREIRKFEAACAQWATGVVKPSSTFYNILLINVYKNAKKNVFSTSIEAYLDTWVSPLGEEILRAHNEAGQPVTRVFVFARRQNVSLRAINAMDNQRDAGVNVRLYFDDESRSKFENLGLRDFTIIDDGDIIGVTEQYGIGRLHAVWYFKNAKKWDELRDVRDTLKFHTREYNQKIRAELLDSVTEAHPA
jgi:hypothetical protein